MASAFRYGRWIQQDPRVTVTAGQDERSFSPCLANGAERSKFEQLKADSGYLHDPLAEELANDANHFSEGAVQLLKFHGSYQQDNRENRQKGQEKDWQMMLRLRSPGGRIPASLYLAMDELADRLGNDGYSFANVNPVPDLDRDKRVAAW